MKKLQKLVCVIFVVVVLVACSVATSVPTAIATETSMPSLVPISSTLTIPSTTPTSIFNFRTVIITPDNLFSFPELKPLNTPNSIYFCEHIPPPQVISNVDKFTLLSGLFVLCPAISWPLEKTAMDLDLGNLVSMDDKGGDISMDYSHPDLEGLTFYGVSGLNSAHIDEIETSTLNYEYCETLLQDKNNPGVLVVHEGAIACVLTTEGQIALIRVENIYPLDTQGVEFSFVVLKE